MSFFRRLFTWWDGQTLGTQIDTWRRGVRVGTDSQGNVYYQTRDGKRRWVIFAGESEASRIDSEWHGWMHHTFAAPPTEVPLPRKPWEKPHLPNLTGTPLAYAPPGSLRRAQSAVPRDYEPWQPD